MQNFIYSLFNVVVSLNFNYLIFLTNIGPFPYKCNKFYTFNIKLISEVTKLHQKYMEKQSAKYH